jgi:hypothetical protein
MEHNDIRHKLSEYIDGSVTSQDKAEIEEHLKTCETCKDALQELRKTIDHVKAIEDIEPPNWMAQKIMAKVRAETEEKKKGFFHRLLYPLAVKVPIQAVAVLFLTITVYYIYSSIHPAERYGEAPIEPLAKQGSPADGKDTVKGRAPEVSVQQEKKVSQEPGYKSLDMKYSYEKPAPPVPQEQPAATGSVPAKREFLMAAEDEASHEKQLTPPKAKAAKPLHAGKAESPEQRAAVPRTFAPAMEAEQAAGTSAPAATDASVSRAADKDAEEILSVMEHFVRYDLPEGMKKKGLQYSARRVPKDLAGLQWLRGSTAYRSSTCTRTYLVDVEFSGKSSKYLYCYDQDHPRLLGIYELNAGTWVEQK